MNVKILLSIIAILLIARTPLHSQTPMQILDKTAAVINGSDGLGGNFTVTTFDGNTPRDKVTGTIQLKGQMYFLKTPQITTWYNGHKMWTYIQGSDEVSQTVPTDEELHKSSPTAFLSIYKKGYKLSSKTVSLRGKSTWEVTLSSKSKKNSTPQTNIVNIDKQTSLPMCVRIHHQGQWTRISMSGIKTLHDLSPTQFDFPSKDYPGVQVIEL